MFSKSKLQDLKEKKMYVDMFDKFKMKPCSPDITTAKAMISTHFFPKFKEKKIQKIDVICYK